MPFDLSGIFKLLILQTILYQYNEKLVQVLKYMFYAEMEFSSALNMFNCLKKMKNRVQKETHCFQNLKNLKISTWKILWKVICT